MKQYRRLPALAQCFNPDTSKDTWPSGIIEYKPKRYQFVGGSDRPVEYLQPGDYIVYEWGTAFAMNAVTFNATFELIPDKGKK